MKKKQLTASLLATAVTLSLIGCGQSSSGTATTAAPAAQTTQAAQAEQTTQAEKEPESSDAAETAPTPLDTVTMLVNYKATEAPADDNPILLAIKDHTGTTVDITWAPQEAYDEKLNTLIASQQLPMITIIMEVKSAGFINAARSGMFWDLTPYLDQFENLSKIDKQILAGLQTDGKQYMIPRLRQTARRGGMIRSDWLKNLGLEMPTTIDELTEILRAFTYDDPDQNGVDDTVGMSMMRTDLKSTSTAVSMFLGGCNEWKVEEDGSFTSKYEEEEYTKALTIFHDWYAEGLINKDFPIIEDQLSNFTSGKAGMIWMGNIEDATTRIDNLTAIDPNATADVFQILTDGPDGEKHIEGYRGHNGCLAIPTTSVKTEEELLQVLAFIDKLGDPEMCDLFTYGIEGDSYTIVDGGVSQTEEELKVYASKYNQLRQINPFYTWRNLQPSVVTPLAEKVAELMETNVAYTVFDPSLPYISETETELGGTSGELATFIRDAATNYVIGEITLEQYLDYVEQWKEMGGSAIAKEYAEQYQPK